MPKTASRTPSSPSKKGKSSKKVKLTPMLRHYMEVKADYPDALLFYRMGDFYELFFEDAERAAPVLEVTLTARHKGTPNPVPMCGVPHHALQTYLGKALGAGLKVAMISVAKKRLAACESSKVANKSMPSAPLCSG